MSAPDPSPGPACPNPRGPAAPEFWLGLLAMVFIYWFLATALISQTNRDRTRSDQQFNIELADRCADHWWPHASDGVVNPLWPWLAARLRGASDAETFVRGRWFNVAFSTVCLIALACWLVLRMPVAASLGVTMVCALGAFLPQAVYFQPETLYFAFFLAAWIAGWELLGANPWRGYAAMGAGCALAYLAKASVTPLLMVFTAVSGLRWIAAVSPRARAWTPREWCPARHWPAMALLFAVFAAPLAPMLVRNHAVFGDAFHSFPKYWMWQTDFGSESVPFMARFNDPAARAAMTPDEIPSLKNYLRKHGVAGALRRLRDGTWNKVSDFLLPEGRWRAHRPGKPWKQVLRYRGLYLLPGIVGAAVLAVLAWRNADPAARWTGLLRGVYLVGGCLFLTLLYGWYDAIGRGDRFMMSLFAPLQVLLFLGGTAMRDTAGRGAGVVYFGMQWALIGMLVLRVVALLRWPSFA